MMDYDHYDNTALDIIRSEILKPAANPRVSSSDEIFNPWEPFTLLYGSYSSAFDEMAIQVLVDLVEPKYQVESLAHEMFREMLCCLDLCEYGTSPRACFARTEFKEILPQLIDKWKQYCVETWESNQ